MKSNLGVGSTFTYSFKLQADEMNQDGNLGEENFINRDTFFFEWEPEIEY